MAGKPDSGENTGDLDSVLAALHDRSGPLPVIRSVPTCERSARSNRRAGLGLALVALLACGILQVVTAVPDASEVPSGDSRAGVVFANAQAGTCLTWPSNAPDKPSFVQCREDHLFEVAKSVEMTSFGEPCQSAVRQYLGPRYDPDSRFTISVLWAGDATGGHTESRRLLCGLELLGVDGRATPFKGQVAAQDQSKVWPAGTCLGIDANTRRSTDLPVDCATAHAVEVTATVDLADRFAGPPPSALDQGPVLGEECTRLSEAYVYPIMLRDTGLRVEYGAITAASWDAGSRLVSCGLVSTGEPAPVVGSVRRSPSGDQAAPPPQQAPAVPPPAPAAPPPSRTTAPPPSTTSTPPAGTPSATASSAAPSSPSTSSSSAAPTPSPATSSSSPPPTSPQPAPLGPPPGPSVEPSSEGPSPAPGVIEIPGLAPITLPGNAPPAPAR